MDPTARVSVALLAEMALAAYQDDPWVTPQGWEAAETFRTGYAFSVLFRHPARNRFVLANRGTDGWDWLGWEGMNNVGMTAADRLPEGVRGRVQYGLEGTALRHAHHTVLRAAAAAGPQDFYVTGHSQGGTLAVLQAAARRLPAVVFNPMTARLSSGVWDRTDPTRFLTVRHHDDIAGHATRHAVGRSVVVGPTENGPKLTPLQEMVIKLVLPPAVGHEYTAYKLIRAVRHLKRNHSMVQLLTVVAADPAFHTDLGWLPDLEDAL